MYLLRIWRYQSRLSLIRQAVDDVLRGFSRLFVRFDGTILQVLNDVGAVLEEGIIEALGHEDIASEDGA
jgi:hypothetical protein